MIGGFTHDEALYILACFGTLAVGVLALIPWFFMGGP